MVKYGIDISHHQGNIDLSKFKDHFIIIRVLSGKNLDNKAIRNMDMCDKLGIPYGVYIYSYALSVKEAKEEAKQLLKYIKDRKLSYPVYYDMEDADGYKKKNGALDGKLMKEMCKAFCEEIENAGYYVGIYASESWFNSYLKGLDDYDKWIASYGKNDGKVNKDFKGKCGMYQYTSRHKDKEKYNGYLDRNIAYYDFPSIIKKMFKSKKIKQGDKVKVLKPVHYDTKKEFKLFYNRYDVLQVKGNRVVIGKGKTVTAPIHIDNLEKV